MHKRILIYFRDIKKGKKREIGNKIFNHSLQAK